MLCKRCVMPESKPDIYLNEQGLCNICSAFESQNNNRKDDTVFHETELVKILNKHRGKHKYDCLVMISGGKDSTSSLYYIVKKYKLNPLAMTFDHGFENEEAIYNIKNAVDSLKVDWIFFKTDFMKEMFAEIIRTKSKAVICHLCSIWYMQFTYETARRYDIPIIIAGWTKGQSNIPDIISKGKCDIDAPEYQSMAKATKKFLKEHVRKMPKYKDFPMSMEEVIKRAAKKHKATVLSPHWFLKTPVEEYTRLIQEELGWRFPKESYPEKSTNCLLNFLSVLLSLKHYGYTHYHVEMSKMINLNMMTRDEALDLLEKNWDDKMIDDVLTRLGLSRKDIEDG
ncbi:MAG: hypothetical protein C0601_02280 [Candidatus Muiribacterium halophilum]|uniref:N-acetyl sugar amidotransferase n=1 Tax=Muiribacterium halophilum TaxID=2053465 RepID=A0A2N5ZKT6_MUIH1|nr:MAG: hypothetical protein C0601_02280 [Candidatus Muirbacterium halophilum]